MLQKRVHKYRWLSPSRRRKSVRTALVNKRQEWLSFYESAHFNCLKTAGFSQIQDGFGVFKTLRELRSREFTTNWRCKMIHVACCQQHPFALWVTDLNNCIAPSRGDTLLRSRHLESRMHVHFAKMFVALLVASSAGITAGHAQPVTLDEAAKQTSPAALANNASILMLYDLECLTQPARDADELKSQINTYAAAGERQVGRENFRKLFFDELSARRQALRAVGPVAWCERVAVQLQALGVSPRSKSAAD
jgi:hypothetical protein